MSTESQYTDIRAALTAQLSTMTGVPAVAWENSSYTPVVGTPYLIPNVLWAEGSQAELGASGRNWERGIYQITCVYPAGAGTGALNTMIGKLRDRFKRGTVLTYNGVIVTIRKVSVSPMSIDNSSTAGAAVAGISGASCAVSISFYSQVAN